MKYSGIELIRHLSLAFGPSGCEDAVRDLITEQIEGQCDGYCQDRVGNLIAKISGRGMDYDPKNPQRVMLAAHMDEVGFMVTGITEEGYLKFGTVGGIDPAVLCGRPVTVAHGDEFLQGVIASKAIHLQTPEERKSVTPVSKMYIDVGATDKQDAENHVSVGDCVAFRSDFEVFGEGGCQMKGKALDDRAGCAALIEIMRDLYETPCDLPFDVYFAFTRCEEVGISGANVAAHTIAPTHAIVMEATAVNDLPGVSFPARVSELCKGGIISLVDGGTIYDNGMVQFSLRVAEAKDVPCQIKQYTSGANDARVIQRSREGVKVLGLALPTRYIHSASCVATYADYEAYRDLVIQMLRHWNMA